MNGWQLAVGCVNQRGLHNGVLNPGPWDQPEGLGLGGGVDNPSPLGLGSSGGELGGQYCWSSKRWGYNPGNAMDRIMNQLGQSVGNYPFACLPACLPAGQMAAGLIPPKRRGPKKGLPRSRAHEPYQQPLMPLYTVYSRQRTSPRFRAKDTHTHGCFMIRPRAPQDARTRDFHACAVPCGRDRLKNPKGGLVGKRNSRAPSHSAGCQGCCKRGHHKQKD